MIELEINGISYSFPEVDDKSWGNDVTIWATAITAAMLQQAGGDFTLTGDVKFGPDYGLQAHYYKTNTEEEADSDMATEGQFRLSNIDSIQWRNGENDGNLKLEVQDDELYFDDSLLSGSFIENPMTSLGDLIVGGEEGSPDRLGVGTNGYVLTADSASEFGVKWAVVTAGDMEGPASSTDNALVRFDSTTGKLLQNSGIICDDSDNLTAINSLRTKTKPVYNVLEWGLLGDDSTDNATAMGILIAALPSTGAKIYFPAGTYRMNSYISFGSIGNLEIYGDSKGGTKIDFSNSNFTQCWRTFGDYCYIHDLWFKAYTGYGHYSLSFTGKYSRLKDLYFTGGDAFVGGAANSNNLWENIIIATDSDGIDNADSFSTFINVKTNSYSLFRNPNNTFIGCFFDSHAMAGTYALSFLTNYNTLIGCYIYGASRDIDTDSASHYNSLINCQFGRGNLSLVYHAGAVGLGGFSSIIGTGDPASFPLYHDKFKDLSRGATLSYKRVKVTKAYTDFSTAGLTNNIEILSLPAGASIRDCYARVTTTFTGGAIATYTISLGITGTEEKYLKDLDVKTSAVSFLAIANKGSALQISDAVTALPTNIESFSGVTSIKAFATSSVANLDQATQGVIEIYVEYSDIE